MTTGNASWPGFPPLCDTQRRHEPRRKNRHVHWRLANVVARRPQKGPPFESLSRWYNGRNENITQRRPKTYSEVCERAQTSWIIVDSNAQTPLTSYVVRTAREIPTIVAVTSRAPKTRIEILERRGVKVFVCGKGSLVSLKILLQTLRKLGIRKILLEGGGALNWSMLSSGLVDEVSVAITPRILGGEKAVTLVEGKGRGLVRDGVNLKLLNTTKYGPDLVVR